MIRTKHFFVATTQVKDGPRHVFVVFPDGEIKEDPRTPEQICDSAVAKGFEISYCALYTHSIGLYTSEQLRVKLVNIMRFKYADVRSEWDIEIDVVNRILDPGEEGRKYNLRVVGERQ